MTPETAPPRRDRVLGERYRLVERIDAGGAGEVWRGRDERLGREVAVKLLGATADHAFRERFTDEARRAAIVSHPNVVTVFDQGQDGPDAYMVMEFVRGRTLRDVVAERGALAPLEAARIVAQVADALDAAHAAGVIHCDVKPANVILDERGVAKLTDFGVARAARGPAEHELIATPRYIAPERIEGKPPTPASDVYGLGLVAFELIAGHPPFDGVETEDLLRERLEGPPPSLRRERPGIAPEIDLVVAKALARDPQRRYGSAGAFARDLLSAVRGERTVTMPMIPPTARPLRRSDRRVGIGGLIALLAAVAVLVGVALLFLGFPRTAGFPGFAPTASPTVAAHLTPNVVGKNVTDAANILLAAGFRGPLIPWQIQPGASGAPCSVVRQDPAAQTPYQPGAAATLYLAPGSCGGD
ncbi:MAG: serine/threonine protein kinase [Chloroflexota bacterium]|nr:serine/threonine protein kinase [Chloroflexota bacterium]